MASELIIKLVRKHLFLSVVSDDLVGDEQVSFNKFCKIAQAALAKHGDRPPNPYNLALQCEIDLAKLHKDSLLSPAVWIAYMFIFLEPLLRAHSIKYHSLDYFIDCYERRFTNKEDHPIEEQIKLFATGNLMNVFFNYVPAKKNKGLILQVIPRLIEGWKVKYITGTGQTVATKDRVHIYETEGHVKPFHRGKDRNKLNASKELVDPIATNINDRPQLHPKKRQLPAEYVSDEEMQRRYHQRLALSQEGQYNTDARLLNSCSWSDSIVALARSYSLQENSNSSRLLAAATASVMPPTVEMQAPRPFQNTVPSYSFEEQQQALKKQICERQNALVERIPSFDSAFPPVLSPISREVSWDRDLNGPGDNSAFPPMKPIINHCLWF